MARPVRIQYPGAAYHVMSRGNGGARIFHHDGHRHLFLETLGEACRRAAWEIHAYVLMDNHYHFLLVTPEGNLVDGMKWFQGTFTQRYNTREERRGHLFQGRYRAQLVAGEEDHYFSNVANYIHLNPWRAGLLHPKKGKGARRRKLTSYTWSSLPHFLSHGSKRPAWLHAHRVLEAHGWRDGARGRTDYVDHLEERIREEAREPKEHHWHGLQRGWFYGSETFGKSAKKHLENALDGRPVHGFEAEPRREVNEAAAEKLVRAGLKALKVAEKDLPSMKKNALEKALLAWAVKSETTVSNDWIRHRLSMGHPTAVSNAVRRVREANEPEVRREKRRFVRAIGLKG